MSVYFSVLADRLRAVWWRWRVGKLGSKVRIGPRCRCFIPAGIELGMRVWLEADVWLKLTAPDARVMAGDFTFFGRNCHLNAIDRIVIGSNTLFGPGCVIVDHNHGIQPDRRIDEQPCEAKPICIGSDVWCGAGVVILPGVTIGDGAVIGAHSVVTRDIPPMMVAAGSPARILHRRGEKRQAG